jgi:hypothetical protein
MKKVNQKLSEILKEMAQTLLINPEKDPSSEAASAALLFASTAWNIAMGQKKDMGSCKTAIREFEECNPTFWDELKDKKWQKAILRLVEYKKKNYPYDNRIIIGCAVMKNKVRVEWICAQK